MINYSDIYFRYCDDFKRLKTLTSLFNFLLKHFDLFLLL